MWISFWIVMPFFFFLVFYTYVLLPKLYESEKQIAWLGKTLTLTIFKKLLSRKGRHWIRERMPLTFMAHWYHLGVWLGTYNTFLKLLELRVSEILQEWKILAIVYIHKTSSIVSYPLVFRAHVVCICSLRSGCPLPAWCSPKFFSLTIIY